MNDGPDPLITLLTDFGDADGFVGAMRGVLKSRSPRASLVDLAHHVPRGDVTKAARVLVRAAVCFPPGTIHLVVVDPGVGSSRRPLAVTVAGHVFVAPDNGVLDLVCEALGGQEQVRLIANSALFGSRVSTTFHGRDVFAPTAGSLAAGFDFADVGPVVTDRVRHPRLTASQGPEGWTGQIVEVDQYGNLITNLVSRVVGPSVVVRWPNGLLAGPSSAYSAVPPGSPVLVVGSEGTLEIAVRDGSAALRLGLTVGDEVSCSRVDEAPHSIS